MTKYYWFNIQLGRNFKYGAGVYAQHVNLVLDDKGKILWENYDKETRKEIWSEKPTNIGFDRKDEIVKFVSENPKIVEEAVLDSYKYREQMPLWKDFSVWCHECFDSDGDNFIECTA